MDDKQKLSKEQAEVWDRLKHGIRPAKGGAAYVYKRHETTWILEQKVTNLKF